MEQNNEFSLVTILRLLFACYLPLYRSQQALFCSLFSSFHIACGEQKGYEWLANQGMISALLSGKRKVFPRAMMAYYSCREGRDRIRHDMRRFVDDTVATAYQRENIKNQLLSLVSSSTNLNREDREFILAYTSVSPEYHVHELLSRMMTVAIGYCRVRK